MWYFTGKGDSGETTLFDGTRVRKDNPILDLVGTIDELNAFIGFTRTEIKEEDLDQDLFHNEFLPIDLLQEVTERPLQNIQIQQLLTYCQI